MIDLTPKALKQIKNAFLRIPKKNIRIIKENDFIKLRFEDEDKINKDDIVEKKQEINFVYNNELCDLIKSHVIDWDFEIELIPNNFDHKAYELLNPDLKGMNENELILHYLNHGFYESRLCHIPDYFPNEFDPEKYRSINGDLHNLNEKDLIKHYIIHGYFEKRTYKTIVSDKKIDDSSAPLFINHECSLTGAPLFLYDFVTYLKNNNIIKNPIILEPHQSDLFNNYEIKKIYHENDLEKLLEIIRDINPVFIYSNSINLYYNNIDKFTNYWHKTYFHFHETLSCLDKNILKIKQQKIFVVSDTIKKEFESLGCSNVQTFPPFIPQEKIFHIENYEIQSKNTLNIKKNKVTIGMSGSICDRKNFNLFYKLAERYNKYEFVWVGGKDWIESFRNLYGYSPKILSNFHHVAYSNNPYLYFKDMDYFFLTSKIDPCPIVVLENLLLNNRIITIKNNIFYQHDKSILKYNLIEIEENEENKIIDFFGSLNLIKYKKNNIGKRYIKENFSRPIIIKHANNKNNFLVFNFYKPSNRYEDADINYFLNLINNFNINNKFSYKVLININVDNGYKEKFSKEKLEFFKKKYQTIFKNIINLEHIELSVNIGWDINGLLILVNKIFKEYNTENARIAYLHSKSNLFWREELNNIFYLNCNEIENYDTVVSEKFFIDCSKQDLNRNFMKSLSLFEDIACKDFKFIGGTIFITKLQYLKNLYKLNKELRSNLTKISTKNNLWIRYMKDDDVFYKYYNHYLNDIYNSPIDIESKDIVEKGLANNFIELNYKFGKKGIPDFHFEHSLERYIGFLISENKKVKTI